MSHDYKDKTLLVTILEIRTAVNIVSRIPVPSKITLEERNTSQLLYMDWLLLIKSLNCPAIAPSVTVSHDAAISAVECY
jgi:hypothetical protein